jgi:hypothetical protein
MPRAAGGGATSADFRPRRIGSSDMNCDNRNLAGPALGFWQVSSI